MSFIFIYLFFLLFRHEAKIVKENLVMKSILKIVYRTKCFYSKVCNFILVFVFSQALVCMNVRQCVGNVDVTEEAHVL